ncbi:GNAT family N-acetyltransferase [Bordetella sp. BOR01]|nr:GNAT family N-acetyltransferase [Bordetella sp. BOR01]MBV7482433.1 GNAT family N-acetyltransferase [Bordetella sp. BOR01]
MGLRYVATHQSPEVTQARIGQGECYVVQASGKLIGTIVFRPAEKTKGSAWLDRADVASLGQFAIDPEWQSSGLGGRLMALAETRAVQTGAAEIALDTAEPATHLIEWYSRRGYRFIEYAQWQSVNYRSVIMSRPVSPVQNGNSPG